MCQYKSIKRLICPPPPKSPWLLAGADSQGVNIPTITDFKLLNDITSWGMHTIAFHQPAPAHREGEIYFRNLFWEMYTVQLRGTEYTHIVVQLSSSSLSWMFHFPKLELWPHWTLSPLSPAKPLFHPLAPGTYQCTFWLNLTILVTSYKWSQTVFVCT